MNAKITLEDRMDHAIKSIYSNPSINLTPKTSLAKINLDTSAPAIFVSGQTPITMTAIKRTSMYCLNIIDVCIAELETKRKSKYQDAIRKNKKRVLKRGLDTKKMILGCEVPILDPRTYRKHQRVCDKIKDVMKESIEKNPETITHVDYCLYLAEELYTQTSTKRKDIRDNLRWLIQGLNTLYGHLLNELDEDLLCIEHIINDKAKYYGEKLMKSFNE
jgi:hypothetical protein